MKIGLEYEGVIVDSSGKVTRWASIPDSDKEIAKNIAEDNFPCDTFDCLAEARMPKPLVDCRPHQLLKAFFDRVVKVDRAFKAIGHRVIWDEVRIPSSVFLDILLDMDQSLKKKTTWTINNDGYSSYSSKGNEFRGGGVHVNVSSIDSTLIPTWVLKCRRDLGRNPKFKSNYRTNILYRYRYDYKDTIAEYMSFGLSLSGDPADREVQDKSFGWIKTVVFLAECFSSYKIVNHLRESRVIS